MDVEGETERESEKNERVGREGEGGRTEENIM